MSETFEQRAQRRLKAEVEAFEADKVAQAQQQIDWWWQSQRDLEFEDDDMYQVGGFVEYHSTTPSFHKSKRDRDWRIR
jgi:hypothetical protein